MNELGKKIRALRKERKLTLEALAGKQLTKGMLSLIENGKAKPSIESLQYIADQLNVDVTALLDERRGAMLKDTLIKVEELFQQYNITMIGSDLEKKLFEMMEPIQETLTLDSYEEVRLKDIYYRIKAEKGEMPPDEVILQFVDKYAGFHTYSKMIECYHFLLWKYYSISNYELAFRYLREGEQKLEQYTLYLDDLTRLDLYYNLTVTALAVDSGDLAKHYFDKALAISKEKKIYYRIDRLYILMYTMSMSKKDFEKANWYIEKIEILTQFLEDLELKAYYILFKAQYMNIVEEQYEDSLKLLNDLLQEAEESGVGTYEKSFFNIDRMYSFMQLGQVEEALSVGKQINIPSYISHPYDFLVFYRGYAIRAYCYHLLGYKEDAKREIKAVMQSVEDYPKSLYKEIIMSYAATILQ